MTKLAEIYANATSSTTRDNIKKDVNEYRKEVNAVILVLGLSNNCNQCG